MRTTIDRRRPAGWLLPCLSFAAAVAASTLAAPAGAQVCEAPAAGSGFVKVPLITGLEQPMAFQEDPVDGKIYLIERTGALKVFDPADASISTIHTLAVDTTREFGLLGMALDPAFNTNHRLWLYYTIPSVDGVNFYSRLSRFTVQSSPPALIDEHELFSIQHVHAFHVAGDLHYGPDGNLYLTTGANDFGSGDTDLGPGVCVGAVDTSDCARYSSSLGTDLRGKIIRVRPAASAPWYTIPAGNMTGAGMDGRFLSMGHRNPFRIAVDPVIPFGQTIPTLYVAEVGTRYEEINRVTGTGYYGWPIFEGTCSYYPPVGGLPADIDPWLWYHTDADACNGAHTSSPAGIPNLWDASNPNGKAAMGGFVYHHHAGVSNPNKLPSSYDNDLFWWDFSKGLVYNTTMNAAGTISTVERFAADLEIGGSNLVDMDVGRNDALYILEQQEGQLARVDYAPPGTNAAPLVFASASPVAGLAPLAVAFSPCNGGECTSDPNGDALTYEWDFDDGAGFQSVGMTPSHTYAGNGVYNAVLRVTDSHVPPAVSQISVKVVVGNQPPTVSMVSPPDGALFGWGENVTGSASVTDPEDGATPGTIPCSDVTLELFLGHDTHRHNEQSAYACSDTYTLDGHGDKDHALYYQVIRASYTDHPANTALAVRRTAESVLWPKRTEAELALLVTDMRVVDSIDPAAGGGKVLTDIEDGDYVSLRGRNLTGITGVRYRVASGTQGGVIELRRNSIGGTLVASTAVPNTGGYGTFRTLDSTFSAFNTKANYYFVFKNAVPGQKDLFDLDWIEFTGPGVSTDTVIPTVLAASMDRDPGRVTVSFSEPLDAVTAETLANYSVPGMTVTVARLQPDRMSVGLALSGTYAVGAGATVSVSGVKDLAGLPVVPGSTAAFTYRGIDVAGGARGMWTFNEAAGSALDSSGNGNNGAMNGVTRAAGKYGNAAVFDGGTDNVDITNLSLAGDFTVAAWVKLTGTIDQFDAIVGQAGAGQDVNFYDKRLRLYGPGDVIVAGTQITAGVWTHCAITREGTTLRLYLDGREDATGDWAGAFTPQVLGKGNAGSMNEGMLDDVRIHDRALTAAEITKLVSPTDSGMAARWQLDDGFGTTARDVSDFARNGPTTGNPTWEVGIVGGAMDFDGVNDAVDVQDVVLSGDFTVAGWVRPDNAIDNADALVGTNGYGADINLYASLARLYSPGSGDVVVGSTPILPNQWTHLAVTRANGTVKVYVDGTLDGTSATTFTGSFPVRMIGRGNAGFFGGSIDDVRVYRYALADGEVDDLATARTPGLAGHWLLDDATGTNARDASYSDRTAIVTGGGGTWTIPTGEQRGSIALNGATYLNPADFSLPGDFTIAGWVKLTGTVDNQDAIVGQIGAGPDVNFWASRARLYTNAPGIWDVAIESSAISVNTWTHYAFTREGGRVHIYRNGALDTGASATGCWFDAMPIAAFGRGTAGFLTGSLDELRVYDVALRPSEVATLADEDRSGLLVHYKLNGNGLDASGAARTATLNGPISTTGTVGDALLFDGVNDWANNPDLALAGDFTITFSVNLDPTINNLDGVVGPETNGGADLNFYAGFLRLYTGAADVVVAGTAATSGSWIRYSVRRTGSALEIWRNGVLDGSGSWAGTFNVRAIGRGSAGFLGGKIDDLRIYDRAMPAQEL